MAFAQTAWPVVIDSCPRLKCQYHLFGLVSPKKPLFIDQRGWWAGGFPAASHEHWEHSLERRCKGWAASSRSSRSPVSCRQQFLKAHLHWPVDAIKRNTDAPARAQKQTCTCCSCPTSHVHLGVQGEKQKRCWKSSERSMLKLKVFSGILPSKNMHVSLYPDCSQSQTPVNVHTEMKHSCNRVTECPAFIFAAN